MVLTYVPSIVNVLCDWMFWTYYLFGPCCCCLLFSNIGFIIVNIFRSCRC